METTQNSSHTGGLTDQIIMQQFNEYCRLHNIRIFGKVENHTCTSNCAFWEYKNKNSQYTLVFVCKYSRKIHYCGSECSSKLLSRNREGWVCSLTGYQVDDGPYISYISQSKDTFSDTKTLGNNYVRMGTKTKSKSKSRTKHGKPKQYKKPMLPYVNIITSTVTKIMTGEERYTQYKTNTAKFLREVAQSLKNTQTASGGLEFMTTNASITTILASFKHSLRKPAQKNDHRLAILVSAITRFWEKFQYLLDFSIKTIATFTAVCISKLRKGYYIGNIAVFPAIEWVDKHAPTDIQFGGIAGIQCRNMSILWRRLQEKIISPVSNLPLHTMVFTM